VTLLPLFERRGRVFTIIEVAFGRAEDLVILVPLAGEQDGVGGGGDTHRVSDRLRSIDDGEATCFQLPFGEWIRLFRRHSLDIEDLIELRAP